MEKRIKELLYCTTLEKKKHYNAAERKRKYHRRLGVSIIVINVLLGSVLVAYLKDLIPALVKWGAAILALTAAVIASLTTFFKFQQEAEGHIHIADNFLALAGKCRNIAYACNDGLLTPEQLIDAADAIQKRYNELVAGASTLPTNYNDYIEAKKGMMSGEETYTEEDLNI